MPKIGKMFICGLMVVSVVGASAVGVISAHDRKVTEQQVEQQQEKIEAQKEKQEQERRAFINAFKVVVLPEFVLPVTKTSPCG